MLVISNLSVSVDNQNVIRNLSLSIPSGTIHALMGPNGSGKTSLAYTLMGHPRYQIAAGSIMYHGIDITQLHPHKRAQLGIFLAFQYPHELPGVSILNFLKEMHQIRHGKILEVKEFAALAREACDLVGLDQQFLERNVNEGFSGGEKKRFELVQMLLFNPALAILDEIDSGLDVDALGGLTQVIARLRTQNPQLCIVIITHYQRMLTHIKPDHVHIMRDGIIEQSGDFSLVDLIESQGYKAAESL